MRLQGIYQPRPRRAYGRRRFSAQLIEQIPEACCLCQPDVPPAVAQTVRAGTGRRYIVCPCCERLTTRLYARWGRWQCRRCAGLHYASEYTGRRPEAAPERRTALRASAARAKSPTTRRRRLARAEVLAVAAMRRMMEEDARASRAFLAALLPVLIREVAREAKRWRRVLLAALRDTPAHRRALIADFPDAPGWVVETLRASLITPPAEVSVPSTRAVVTDATARFRALQRHYARQDAA